MRGHSGIATREVRGSKGLTVPHLVGDTNNGLRVVEATTVVEEVAAGFAVAVLGQEFSSPKPVVLLDGREHVSGGQVWLGHERSVDVDKLVLRMDSLLTTTLRDIEQHDPLIPRSTQGPVACRELHRDQGSADTTSVALLRAFADGSLMMIRMQRSEGGAGASDPVTAADSLSRCTRAPILVVVGDSLGASRPVAGCRLADGRRCFARSAMGGTGEQPGRVVAPVQLGGRAGP